MRLTPTEDQIALRDAVRRVLDDTYGADARARIAGQGGFDPAVWARFAALGWLALPLPAEHGGLGAGPVEVAVLAHELGRAGVLERWVATIVLAGGLIAALATPEQAAALLPALAEGRAHPALAHTEPTSGDALIAVATQARPDGAGWRLTGAKSLVLDGPLADLLLVSAQAPDGLGLFSVRPDSPGLTLTQCATVDGGQAADLVLADVPGQRLGAGDATQALLAALDRANAAACSDAVGAMEALLAATVEHTQTRAQFGQPLSRFQALRHRMAEMAVALDSARGLALLAALSPEADAATRARAVSGARAGIGRLSRHLAHEAVQLHGAMGISDEVAVGGWFKRLYAFENLWGSTALHQRRYADVALNPGVLPQSLLRPGPAPDDALNLELSPADVAFQAEIREYLDTALTPETRRTERLNPSFLADPGVGLPWQAQLATRGWAAPAWPRDHGGPGWTLTQRYIFDQECARAGEPQFRGASLKMIAPVLMRFGTPAQQAFYLPRILAGQDIWAQGYSEPGAGSDLAALATRAVLDGDDYIVNGTKIWSTHGHHATRMFALVRTADTGKKQQGITFLLIDMGAPGIALRPIRSICGTHEFNQVFFDDVRVPAADRVGAEGDGWTIAKYLLEFERGGAFAGGVLRALLARTWRMAATPGPDGSRALDDPLIAARLAELMVRIDANDMLELSALSAVQAGGNPGSVPSSVMKIQRSRIRQDITEFAASILGPEALRWHPERPLHDLPPQDEVTELRRVAPPAYFNARAQSIFGGSNEIQLEIIARELLDAVPWSGVAGADRHRDARRWPA